MLRGFLGPPVILALNCSFALVALLPRGGPSSAQAREQVRLRQFGPGGVLDAHEGLGPHQMREPLRTEIQEEDVLTLARVRRERLVLACAELAYVDPGADLLVRQADRRV